MNIRTVLFAIVITLSLCACGTKPRTGDESPQAEYSEDDGELDIRKDDYDYTNTSLSHGVVDNIAHSFSELETDDRFSLYIPKGNINNTKAILTIQNFRGDTLFADTMLTTFLISKSDLKYIEDEEGMTNYIIRRAEWVLDSAMFCKADDEAVDTIFSDTIDKDKFDDYSVFEEVKNERRYLFTFSIGDGNFVYLGHSRKSNQTKIVMY